LLKNKDISKLLNDNFILSLNISPSDKTYRDYIGNEVWQELSELAYKEKNGVCQGCQFNPTNKSFIELHVISGDVDDINTYRLAILCKSCHSLQHIDIASNKGWIKLCNSIYDQRKLIHICRSGNSNLIEKINLGEVMILKQNPIEYSKSIQEDLFNIKKKIKAVFGKRFPENRLR
jgi:hypothetical protein